MRTLKAGTSHLLVRRAARQTGHCDIDPAVRERAFDDLVEWIGHGAVPEGDDMLGDVADLGLRSTSASQPNEPATR